MAKNLVENITPRDKNFADWYTDVVREAKLCDYSSVKGCLNYLPNGYAIWENIKNDLDKRFKDTGVENVYLPVLIPESLLATEADHIEGFAPEVAWVTMGGNEELEERMCIRPTSETLFCDYWKKATRSYRDLPFIWNQWNTVLRWEKTTRPFLRSREFLWQEGHTLHATYEEAEERTIQMFDVYKDFINESLAIPLVAGKKTEWEKFAGAQDTYTCEAMMHDGRALQSATSHFFGSGFPDSFDIKYLDKENNLHSCYETSWGLSTRSIGAIIMVHGDDKGLVLPPKIAPTKIMIIPIAMHKEGVLEEANKLKDKFNELGLTCKIDDTDKTPGFKFAQQEILGIPFRVEIGPRDIENKEFVLVRRDNDEKMTIKFDDIEKVKDLVEVMQKDMYKKAEKFLNDHLFETDDYEELKKIAKENIGFVKVPLCDNEECEDYIKYDTGGFSSRCIDPDSKVKSTTKCIRCGKKAKDYVYFGKSY